MAAGKTVLHTKHSRRHPTYILASSSSNIMYTMFCSTCQLLEVCEYCHSVIGTSSLCTVC